ncbi:Formin-binding protein 1 [Polyrhizophydium stewartii]|uniref:Formin-binding protein 1 n=1 Tax=Polyrhizophydium stewartii TaxID=2732419 RepID=A0ABR4NBG0_9FUNG
MRHYLQDQVPLVESYADQGAQFMEKVNDFMKQVASIEADYARSMLRVAKQHKDEIMRKASDKSSFSKAILGSTLSQSWLAVLTETESIANYHLELSEKLDTDHFDEIRKANAELKKWVDAVEKASQKYDRAMKDMESARSEFERANKDQNATKKQVDQLRGDSEKKAVAAQEAGVAYKQCMAQCNEYKNKHFSEIIPGQLDASLDLLPGYRLSFRTRIDTAVQKEDEENRILFSKAALQSHVDLYAAMAPKMERSVQLMTQVIAAIDAKADMDMLVMMNRTGEALPGDLHISDTQEADIGKKTLLRGAQRTRDDKNDDQIEDQIVALPGKQGRRKAADRAKLLEKEALEVDKKRQGIDLLMSVLSEKASASPDARAMDDLLDEKANIEKRIDTLLSKRHKLMVYIAGIDGTAAPEPPTPAHQRAGSFHPRTATSPSPASGGTGQTPQQASLDMDLPRSKDNIAGFGMGDSPSSQMSNPFAQMHGHSQSLSMSPAAGSAHSQSPSRSVQQEKFSGMIPVGDAAVSKPSLGRVRVEYDFEAAPSSHEMTVKAGQILDVLQKQDDGWWLCRGDGREGFVPGNYTSQCN